MASDVERNAVFEHENLISSILDHLNEQRIASRFCDVILRVCGEQIFAHSNVLAAASPYFGSFLGQGQDLPRAFSQKTPQIIEIHIDGSEGDSGYGDAVRKVVDFMYTSKIELAYGILTQVMEIAKIMQMDMIIEYCDRFQKGEDGNMDKLATKNKNADITTQTSSSKANDTAKSSKSGNESTTGNKMIHTPKRKRGRPRKQVENEAVLNGVESSNDQVPDPENHLPENEDGSDEINKETDDETAGADDKTSNKDDEDVPNDDDNGDDNEDDDSIDENISSWIVERTGSGRPVRVPSKYRYSVRKSMNTRMDHIPKKAPGEIYSCPDCPYTSDRLFHFRRHRQAHNNDNKKYNCDECDFTSAKLKALNSHKREHLHAANRCSYCDFNAADDDALQQHLQKHSGPNPFFCNVCDMKFKSKNQLKTHLPKHSEDKPYVCDVCGNGFKWKHALKNHMITHSNRKDHLCDICGFSTAHKSQLKAHHLIHSGETFKCTVLGCSFQATKRQNLKYHMLTHTHEKPHQCEICGQSFSLSKNMKRHMLLHTNMRPYQCEHCRFSTTRYDKLKEHLLKQHGEGELPQRRHRLSDYYKSTVPSEGQRFISAKLEDGTDVQYYVTNAVETEKEEGATGTQFVALQQNNEGFPLTLARIENVNCNDEINLAVQQAVHFVTQCD